MKPTFPTHLTDPELLSEVIHFAHCEREATAQLVAHLAVLDSRRLYLAAGLSSLFTYCCDVLGLSENEAYNRIEAARAARRFPIILAQLASASLNLTTVRLLSPHLTPENHEELIAAATGRTKREVEELLARRFPRPDVPDSIRKLPTGRAARAGLEAAVPTLRPSAPAEAGDTGTGSGLLTATPLGASSQTRSSQTRTPLAVVAPQSSIPRPPAAPSSGGSVAPLAADRYQVRFTAGAETCRKLRQAQDLLRHAIPSGDLAQVFDRALTALLAELARSKTAAIKTAAGRRRTKDVVAPSRRVPAAVRRAVWVRDQGRCAFASSSGRRCGERGFLEFHHVRPYAVGGPPTVENIQLRCRAHNAYESSLFYGPLREAQEAADAPCRRPTVHAASTSHTTATRSGTSSPDAPGGRPRGSADGLSYVGG